MDGVYLDKAIYYLTQECNTLGTTMQDGNEVEQMQIEVEYACENGLEKPRECFYVLKTSGWSIDGPEDIQDIINKIHGGCK